MGRGADRATAEVDAEPHTVGEKCFSPACRVRPLEADDFGCRQNRVAPGLGGGPAWAFSLGSSLNSIRAPTAVAMRTTHLCGTSGK